MYEANSKSTIDSRIAALVVKVPVRGPEADTLAEPERPLPFPGRFRWRDEEEPLDEGRFAGRFGD